MPEFNLLKKFRRSKRDKAHRGVIDPTPSGQQTSDSIQGSVDPGAGGQPAGDSAITRLAEPRTNREDERDVAIHTIANSRSVGIRRAPNTVEDSVGLGIGGQPIEDSTIYALADALISPQDHPDAAAHTTADPRPGNERTPDVPIILLDIASSISGVADLRDPLNFTSEALMKLLETVKSIDPLTEDWNFPLKRLRFHLDTIASQSVTLEEDSKIDKAALSPPLSPDHTIIGPLERYVRELNKIYQLLCDRKTADSSTVNINTERGSNEGILARTIRDMDAAFEEYTDALHALAAESIVQIKQDLPQTDQETSGDAHYKPPKVPNVYGVQHVRCLRGTREKTRKAISDWVDDKSSEKPIFLLLDVAGSGKSTVAKHMANDWVRDERLLARFFFSRDTTTTMSTASFCSTVADAFGARDPKFKDSIKVFKERTDLALLPFEELFYGLVTSPLEQLDRDAILIIDALDECDNERGSRDELLDTLHSQRSSIPRLRILATGRPELDIKQWAEKSGVRYANFIQLEGGQKDVEIYIRDRLEHLPHIQDHLYPVIKSAEGVFIWARIACDLILNNDDVDSLLEELGKEVSLDYLYKVALNQSIPKPSRQAFTRVLEMILASRGPLSIAELEMLSPKRGIVERIVSRLGAVLLYKDRNDPIRLLHATFREFLIAQSKAGIYFIQPERGHQTLALGCLRVISGHSVLDPPAPRKLDHVTRREDNSIVVNILLTLVQDSCLLVDFMGASLYCVVPEAGVEQANPWVCVQHPTSLGRPCR